MSKPIIAQSRGEIIKSLAFKIEALGKEDADTLIVVLKDKYGATNKELARVLKTTDTSIIRRYRSAKAKGVSC